ncbi:hypothetical protein JOH51_004569 [Rhizobium leguminosarum]|nr:hypothetical protein [Rhizobium leguminosarum]
MCETWRRAAVHSAFSARLTKPSPHAGRYQQPLMDLPMQRNERAVA